MLVYRRAVGPEVEWSFGFLVNGIGQLARLALGLCLEEEERASRPCPPFQRSSFT
jgi:hypothetical protein